MRILLTVSLLFTYLLSFTQDRIVLKESYEAIDCEIVCIDETNFIYKVDGKTLSIVKENVFTYILFDSENRASKLCDGDYKVTEVVRTDSVFYQATVNGVNIEDIESPFIRIVGTSKFLSTKIRVNIEFGQEIKYFKNTTTIKDGLGNPIDFNSMIDAMNYMSYFGYEFLQAYVITVGEQNVYHYLMKRK